MTASGGRKRRIALLGAAGLAIAVAVAIPLMLARGAERPAEVRIATGLRGGAFLPLGETLARELSADLAGTRFSALESPGGLASVRMLEEQEAELALLSNHVVGSGNLRLIASLYDETLQIVVRREAAIAAPTDLRGHRVSVGPEGSGTQSVADEILEHFGVGRDGVERRYLGMGDAADALERGEIDAAFMVAGMRTPAVDRLLRRDDMELLSLGEPGRVGSALDGIRVDAPFFAVTAIPERAYGAQPSRAIGTISVRALLVARGDLPEEVVFEITETLFQHKVELASHSELLANLDEHVDLALSPYPLHPGADRYYRRDEPTLIQRYADSISLLITIAALVWSAITAIAAIGRQSRKNRIEGRYGAAQELAAKARAAQDREQMLELREKLIEMRERALSDLAGEQLDANEAFVILQDYLTAQIGDLERRIDAPGM